MSLLKKALALWLKDGHTQKDLHLISGIDQGTCSLLFKGERGLTLNQRARIVRAFQSKASLAEGLALVTADLRDNIPPEAQSYIQVIINAPATVKETGSKKSRVAAAKAEFQRDLDIDDPDTIDLVLSLYDWRHPKNKP